MEHPLPPGWGGVGWGVREEAALSLCHLSLLPGQCSTTCGLGTYWRSVQCSTQVDSDCAALQRPDPAKRCHLRPCAGWKVGNWSKVIDQLSRVLGGGGGGTYTICYRSFPASLPASLLPLSVINWQMSDPQVS